MADGERVDDLIPHDERIRLIHLDRHIEIGEKRNIGCEFARGDLIAHWDDDDHSEPRRLDDQIRRLHENNKSVTGYHSMRFTDGERWWQYRGAKHYGLGTSFVYKRAWWQGNRFPLIDIGEDNDFIGRANMHGVYIGADAGELMYATVHQNNTSPREMSGRNWAEL